ncbi:SOS response-associated peptidase [Desulfonatronum thiodismutans]|uniref:SOS response-associated peptidase n=1 Tax=Desulfonatronum thiodismutans TaxID=159290 RepID=UPI0004ABECB6|nr:SOS response-associated peptidase [Desulfonatronum thiodismutans]
MCGRFALWITLIIPEHYGLVEPEEPILPSYNIAPGQEIVAVVQTTSGRNITRLKWGLIPSWTRDLGKSPKSINARSETVWDKPCFRSAVRHRRCLIPANRFLEWEKVEAKKQPYLIRFENLELFSMAGIWESWLNPETGETIESCAILTTKANEAVAAIHDRMPVIIKPEDYATWLAPKSHREQIETLLQPFADMPTQMLPVSTRVNSPKNNDPECIVPVLLPDDTQQGVDKV